MNNKVLKQALIDAGATTAYIIAIAALMFNIENFVDNSKPDTFLAPVIMLLLFVSSAAITGFAVFGVPAMWYMDGKKKEAIQLIGFTIVFLIIAALLLIAFV